MPTVQIKHPHGQLLRSMLGEDHALTQRSSPNRWDWQIPALPRRDTKLAVARSGRSGIAHLNNPLIFSISSRGSE
jgi:hypothetical protein